MEPTHRILPVPAPNEQPGSVWIRVGSMLPAFLLFGAGFYAAFRPTINSGFQWQQTDLYDTRFNHYLLEHSWRWCVRDPHHLNLWNPPVGYPAPNVLAYGDMMLTFAPPYWAFRAAGVGPAASFSLWMMAMAALNYLVGCLFLRRGLRLARPGAAAGAVLLAFGSPLIAQLAHQQLLPQFFVLGALWSILRLFDAGASSGQRRRGILTYYGCLLAQLYGGFYMAFFVWWAVSLALAWALAIPAYRIRCLGVLRGQWRTLAWATAAALALAAPWILHYGAAAQVVGLRGPGGARAYLPHLVSWVLVTERNPFYRWMAALPSVRLLAPNENYLGLGFLTTSLALAGLWRLRHRPFIRLAALAAATMALCITVFPGGFYLWRVAYYAVPGLQAIRAPGRVAILFLIPAAAGLGTIAPAAKSSRARGLAWLLVALCLLEQFQTTRAYPVSESQARIDALARQIDDRHTAFLALPASGQPWDWGLQIDAMWASLETGKPTVNLYSGNYPPDWPWLRDPGRARPVSEEFHAALQLWMERRHLAASSIQLISPPSP